MLLPYALISNSFADQCAVVSKEQASNALKYLQKGMPIYGFCQPCGQKLPDAIIIQDVRIQKWTASFAGYNDYNVFINQEGIDLAYIYVPDGRGNYINLAIIAGCPVSDVSEYLPAPAPAPAPAPTPPSTIRQPKMTLEKLKNSTYYVYSLNRKIKLKNGEYISKQMPYEFVRLDEVISGDLNHDGREDVAIILDGSWGGTGTFQELAIIISQNGEPHHVTSAILEGKVESMSFVLGGIIVNMKVHVPDDPNCCPTLRKTVKYEFGGNKLERVMEY